jgi:hypothetical protein
MQIRCIQCSHMLSPQHCMQRVSPSSTSPMRVSALSWGIYITGYLIMVCPLRSSLIMLVGTHRVLIFYSVGLLSHFHLGVPPPMLYSFGRVGDIDSHDSGSHLLSWGRIPGKYYWSLECRLGIEYAPQCFALG